MAEVTVKQLAGVVGTSVERLLDQIKEAGLKASGADAVISDQDKLQLLDYLRGQHGKSAAGGEERGKKITLKRKSVSELKTGSGPGRGRTVAIEVRKKRTIAKPGDVEEVVKPPVDGVKPKELEDLEKLRADQAQRKLERDQEQERIRARAELRKQESEKQAARIAEAKAPSAVEAEPKIEPEIEPEAPVRAVRAESEKPRAKKSAGEMATPDVVQAEDARRDKGGKKPPRHEKTLHGRTELHVSTDKSGKRKKKKGKYQSRRVVAETRHGFEMPVEPVQHEVNIPETITVDELARRMSMKVGDLIKALMKMGVMATINQVVDQDTAALVVEELGHKVVTINEDDRERELLARDNTQFEEYARAPVVTIMGHVDHGKTSLLDHIRTSKIATGEAGGITQHIGAYHVETDKGMITFLDTPGHAAFTSMRERGANATDVVILVVAADDGVMPQTIEAIQHAKAANVPIIVAVNKVDKEDADPERVKNELGNYAVISEEWGGENVFVNVSAKTGQGIDDLLDAILLQAELMELKAHSEGPANGVVLEASLDKGRGVTTTVLVQQGTLKKGDIILAGEEFGRVRAMFNEFGKEVEQALPSIPVAVIGLSKTPSAGDEVLVVEDERTAREVTDKRRQKARDLRLAGQQQTKLDSIFDQMKAGEVTKLNILLKADVQGTLEAIRESLLKLTADNEEIDVAIVGSGVGGINETDISLAAASNAIVLGFNVRADASARTSAAERGVDINYYSVIYELIDDVKKALVGLLKPEFREQIIGLAKVQEVFRSQQLGQVAGSLVTEGTIKRSRPIRVLRDNVVIFEGELESLRRYKDDVEEVKSGTECGIAVKNYNDVRPGDQIEVFERVEVERTL